MSKYYQNKIILSLKMAGSSQQESFISKGTFKRLCLKKKKKRETYIVGSNYLLMVRCIKSSTAKRFVVNTVNATSLQLQIKPVKKVKCGRQRAFRERSRQKRKKQIHDPYISALWVKIKKRTDRDI